MPLEQWCVCVCCHAKNGQMWTNRYKVSAHEHMFAAKKEAFRWAPRQNATWKVLEHHKHYFLCVRNAKQSTLEHLLRIEIYVELSFAEFAWVDRIKTKKRKPNVVSISGVTRQCDNRIQRKLETETSSTPKNICIFEFHLLLSQRLFLRR